MEFPIDLLKTFLAIIDTGGFTNAGQVVHRTQSAISMQIKRLEETVGQPLFERSGRSFTLTAEGELLAPYARRMLKLHEEAVSAMIQPEMVGQLRIGTPDDYALQFLPGILAQFARAYPRVQVTVRCEPSSHLAPALANGEMDLTLLTGDIYRDMGDVVRNEPLVWAASAHHLVHEETPLPLAMFQSDCVFRKYAFQSLDSIGRAYRVAYQSASTAGILAAVSAGLAVTVIASSVIPPEIRTLGPEEGLPPLPVTPIVLATVSGKKSTVATTMAKFIREGFQSERLSRREKAPA